MEGLLGRREVEREVLNKGWIVSGKVTFLWRKSWGVYHAEGLTRVDQIILVRLAKGTFLGEAETN